MIEKLTLELERCLAQADVAGEMLTAAHISSAIETLKSSLQANLQENASTRLHMASFSDVDSQSASSRPN